MVAMNNLNIYIVNANFISYVCTCSIHIGDFWQQRYTSNFCNIVIISFFLFSNMYLKGFLQLIINYLQYGFTLDRTVNDAISPYLESHSDTCFLKDIENIGVTPQHPAIVFLKMDFTNLR